MPDFDPRRLVQAQQDLSGALSEKQRVTEDIARRSAEIARLDAEIAQRAALGDATIVAALTADRNRLAAERQSELTRAHAFDDRLRDIAESLTQVVDACDADPAIPLLLLPVRLETRYTADRATLRVRVFPDDIHIDQLDRGIGETELDAWQDYWTAVWHTPDEQADQAWRTLVQRVGARRASWLAIGLQPINLAARSQAHAPVFPEVGPRKRSAAVARLLPDCFVAVAIQGPDRRVAVGRPVAPEVTVGIVGNDGSSFVDVDGVNVMPGAEWLVDFDRAVKEGMALAVPLPHPGAPVDRLVVMGVRRTLDASRTADELEDLLLAHRCTRGLDFVAQGTPTNNTESERAAWRARLHPPRPSRDMAPPASGSNAQVLAGALGIDGSLLAPLEGGDLREQPHAGAASVVFWGPTWATFLEKLNQVESGKATISDAALEQARIFHRDAVRGRGPLPALRVGNQPYGILPVSALEPPNWHIPDNHSFESGLHGILTRARGMWRRALRGVPRVGVGKIDEAVREMLGSSAVSTSLRVRTAISDEAASAGIGVSNADPSTLDVERLIEELVLEEVLQDTRLTRPVGSLASRSQPLGLPLVHEDDVPSMDAMLAGTALPKITSVWQALLQLAWLRAEREVNETGASGRFTQIVGSAALLGTADRDRALAVEGSAHHLDSRALYAEADRLETVISAARPIPTLAEYQPIASTRRGFGDLALQATTEAAKVSLSSLATWAHVRALARRAELREALAELRETTIGERRILLAETLDCASHRLDAWCTGLIERRRSQLRAATPAGLTVGAYGWVENIEPTGDRLGDGGYVHAPSLSHAATAGILRSAYLAHNGPDGDGAFAIDLSSARVRTAVYLLDGIRQGQPLSALLGYRIERQIHEAKLDRLILSLRTIAPLTQGRLTDRGQETPTSAVEALAAANVTDGIELIEKYQGKVPGWSAVQIRSALDKKPENNPYLKDVEWPALTDTDWQRVATIIDDAAEACDAVGDLLMAESVHQLVMGNVTRAAAALDTAGAGEAPPPQPAVIETPVEGIPLSHRLVLIAGGGQPWNLARPRAAAEPRLEAWAGERLGDPSTILVSHDEDGTPRTLDETGLCALDIVYDAGNPTLLEQRVRSTLALPQEIHIYVAPEDDWLEETRAFGEIVELAASLRALLANSRPASPGDLARPTDQPLRQPSTADLAATVQRATLAHGGLRTAAAKLELLLTESPIDEPELWTALEATAAYGVVAPVVSGEQLAVLATAAHGEAARRADDAEQHLQAARDALALPDSPEARAAARNAVIAAGQVLFGDGFWLVPELEAPGLPDLWQAALSAGGLDVRPGQIRRFLADFAAVREPVKRASEAMLLAEALGRPGTLRVAQLAPVGAVGAGRWIGGPLDPNVPAPQEPVTNVVVDAPSDYDPSGATVALVVDQWTDVVPMRERRGNEADAPIDERATSGVAFNAMAPSSRAPNALLLAVAPNAERWSNELLLQTLTETLDLARLRLVNLEHTNGSARLLPALYTQSWSLQAEPALDFKFLSGLNYVTSAVSAYIKE